MERDAERPKISRRAVAWMRPNSFSAVIRYKPASCTIKCPIISKEGSARLQHWSVWMIGLAVSTSSLVGYVYFKSDKDRGQMFAFKVP